MSVTIAFGSLSPSASGLGETDREQSRHRAVRCCAPPLPEDRRRGRKVG
jgi:hypothetical protein